MKRVVKLLCAILLIFMLAPDSSILARGGGSHGGGRGYSGHSGGHGGRIGSHPGYYRGRPYSYPVYRRGWWGPGWFFWFGTAYTCGSCHAYYSHGPCPHLDNY